MTANLPDEYVTSHLLPNIPPLLNHPRRAIKSAAENLATHISIYFQIRDDFQNLNSDEYTNQKGFCEDLDEGKLSFPLAYYLNTTDDTLVLQEVMQQRRENGRLDVTQKKLVLEQLKMLGVLGHTLKTIRGLEVQIDVCIGLLEGITEKKD